MINWMWIAKFICIAVFLSVLFYFAPRAHDRLWAKRPPFQDRWQYFWWTSVGWMAEPEMPALLLWFLVMMAALGIIFWLG